MKNNVFFNIYYFSIRSNKNSGNIREHLFEKIKKIILQYQQSIYIIFHVKFKDSKLFI